MTVATLYRCRTPTNWLCPCGRVARELRAAGLDYDEERVPWRKDDRDEVDEVSGQRIVPVVEFDGGDVICDSKRIVEHIAWRTGADEPGKG